MNQIKVNYLVDILLLISGILTILTGIIKLPALDFLVLWKVFPIVQVTYVHDLSGVILSVLIILHVVLHLKWYISMTKTMFGDKK